MVKKYALGWALLAMFLVSWMAQFVVSFYVLELPPAEFWKDTFENWQSEFLQVLVFVVLTVKLPFKGSKEAKDPEEV